MFIVDDAVPERLLARRTIDAEILLGREVNVVQMTRDEIARRMESGSSFLRNIFGGLKVWLVGSETDIQAEVESTR